MGRTWSSSTRPYPSVPEREPIHYTGPDGACEEFDSIEALKKRLSRPRTPAEQARISAVVERTLANRKERNIAPMTLGRAGEKRQRAGNLTA